VIEKMPYLDNSLVKFNKRMIMKRLKITTRNRNWFFVSILIVLFGYVLTLEFMMLTGLGCLLFILVDLLADNTLSKSK